MRRGPLWSVENESSTDGELFGQEDLLSPTWASGGSRADFDGANSR